MVEGLGLSFNEGVLAPTFVLKGGQIVQGRVPSMGVVPSLDELEDSDARLGRGLEARSVEELTLQRGEEGLGHRVSAVGASRVARQHHRTSRPVLKTPEVDGEIPVLQPGPYVWLSAASMGVGIRETELHRVFDPHFFTKKRGAKGSVGLGLAIRHAIVTEHGGAITVGSEVGMALQCPYLPAAP